MVLLVLSTATFSGTNLCLFKCFGEILASYDFWNMPVLASSLAIAGVIGATIQIFILNTALRYYNNLDIVPVYQSLILTSMLVSGWVLLDEIQYYEWIEIAGLIGSSCLVISGIKVITMKTSVSATLKE